MIRILRPGDMDAARALWDECFHDPREFADWYFARRCVPENALGWFEDGRLLSMVHAVPRRLCVRGVAVEAPLIVGVATESYARGQGCAGALLAAMLREARRRGWELMPLYPFDHAFYRKYGWEAVYRRTHAVFPLRDLARMDSEGVRMRPAHPARDALAFARAYDASLGHRHGYALRDASEWLFRGEEMDADGARGVVAEVGGDIVGALIYAQDHEEGAIEVQEWLAATPSAERAFLSFLGAHASTLREARLWLPSDAALLDGLPGAKEGHRAALDAMVRLIDPASLIDRCGLSGPAIVLRVHDGILPENDRVFAFADGAMSPSAATPEGEIGIGGLAQLIMGYTDAHGLARRGSLCGGAGIRAKLDAWFGRVPTCILDHW